MERSYNDLLLEINSLRLKLMQAHLDYAKHALDDRIKLEAYEYLITNLPATPPCTLRTAFFNFFKGLS